MTPMTDSGKAAVMEDHVIRGRAKIRTEQSAEIKTCQKKKGSLVPVDQKEGKIPDVRQGHLMSNKKKQLGDRKPKLLEDQRR
jgi:hypothetical protein